MKRLAWDGTAAEFWATIERVRANSDVEGDVAVLCDVIAAACETEQVKAERDRWAARVRLLEARLEAVREAMLPAR